MREKSLKERVMGIPLVYHLFQNGIRKPTSDIYLAQDIIQPQEGHAILDVGCGVGRIRKHLGNVRYVGIDHNSSYIKKAAKTYGTSSEFYVADVADVPSITASKFDRILLLAVIHHLSDSQVTQLLGHCRNLLKPSGFVVSADPTFIPKQHLVSYAISRFDRGRFVRTPEAYDQLFKSDFKTRELQVRNDLLWVPSSTAVISAR